MLLTLYKTLDSDNVINKVLTDPTDFNINLKLDTDLTRPDLLLTRLTGMDYADYNYASIPALGKMYFIRSVTAMNASIFKLSCECDYLETYKLDILNSQASYKRPIKAGDYGAVSPDLTGREIINDFTSDVVLELADNSILSTIEVF